MGHLQPGVTMRHFTGAAEGAQITPALAAHAATTSLKDNTDPA
jgi:hypothetical protein